MSLPVTSESIDSNLDSVTVIIDRFYLQNESQLCSIVTASDGILTASVEKILYTGRYS